MGVSGSGKTRVGRALAKRLGVPFLDADDDHPPENVEKMSRGEALNDADRAPWLDRLHALLIEQPDAVLACSALKRRYRRRLASPPAAPTFVYLKVDQDEIARRMTGRDHFFPVSLLDSQFAALEEPGDDEAVIVDAMPAVDQVVDAIVARVARV